MDTATRYYCRSCSAHKFIPEQPLNPTRTVQTGCEHCGRITTHKAVGVP